MKKTYPKPMDFDDFFLLTTSANVAKSNVFGRKNIKNALVFKGFLYCDVSMVYTRFGGFSRRSIFQHSMHGDLRSDQKGMRITVSEEQMQPSEFCKMISDGRRGCGQRLHRKSRNAVKIVQFRSQHSQTVNKFDASMLLYT